MFKINRMRSGPSAMIIFAWIVLSPGLTGCPSRVDPDPSEPCEGIGPGEARFINDAGLVAGNLIGYDQYGDVVYEGVWVWDATSGTRLVCPSRGQVIDLNEVGQVLIQTDPSAETSGCLLWDEINGLQDLGTLGGSWSIPVEINDSGLVVGTSETAERKVHLFLWDASTGMRDVGDLGLTSVSDQLTIFDMNNNGQIAGTILIGQTFGVWDRPRAFFWDATDGLQILGTLGGDGSSAFAMNNVGQVVGWSYTEQENGYGGEAHAFLWDPDNGMVNLGDLGGKSAGSCAEDINDKGQVTGSVHKVDRYGEDWGAFIWDETNGMRRLPTPSGASRERGLDFVQITAINELGQVIGQGWSPPYDDIHVWLWDAATGTRDLGPPCLRQGQWSWAYDINNLGQVVGSVPGEEFFVGYLW